MITTEGKVPYLCLIVLIFFFALSWTKENKKKMWKLYQLKEKSLIYLLGGQPSLPTYVHLHDLAAEEKNVFLKNCVKKFTPTYLWRYYFLVHASPHLHQKMGIKKSPLSVCLSLFWQSKHLKGQLDPLWVTVTFLHQRRSVGSRCW